MDKPLDMIDMNSLNAIQGVLKADGHAGHAGVLRGIQERATKMIHEREESTLVKTVRITNPRNALVQIPSFVVGSWGLKLDDRVEVLYNEYTKEVTLRPMVQR